MTPRPHQTLERVALPSEIQKLPPLEGYLCIAGYDRARVKLQWVEPRRNAPAFILRRSAEATQPATEATRKSEATNPEAGPANKATSEAGWG